MDLLLAVSQEENTVPYTFKATGLKVYSFEEAIFYTYHNWHFDDFLTKDFIDWLLILKLDNLVQKLEKIKELTKYSEKLMYFLSIIYYFNKNQLEKIRCEVMKWEKINESKLLKKEGDTIIFKSPKEAIKKYEKAIKIESNVTVYNNLAISYMKNFEYEKAVIAFKTAHGLDKENIDIILNYANALIETLDIKTAIKYISKARSIENNSRIHYLNAKIAFKNNDIASAICHMEEAISVESKDNYFYYLSNLYILENDYKNALIILKKMNTKNENYYEKLSEIYALCGNFSSAISSVNKAYSISKSSKHLAILASYHRQNRDLETATRIIKMAVNMPDNNLAKIEEAKIKKAKGYIKDYQNIMDSILKEAKSKYFAKNSF
ncbi:MAG: hypothetical protein FWF57_07525 [Defluviitaleaceae bacterium]|nr:hypothetical protein [Defluviitaleaceae bacterium]